MKRSTERILTTHCGSLPRPDAVVDAVAKAEQGALLDPVAFDLTISEATVDVVRRQLESGLDVINDGEQGKFSFNSYYRHRFSGLEVRQFPPRTVIAAEAADYPGYFARWPYLRGDNVIQRPVCVGPIEYTGHDALRRDIAWLQNAARDAQAEELFMTAISPATVIRGLPNEFTPPRPSSRRRSRRR